MCRVFSNLMVMFPLLNSRGILKKVDLSQVQLQVTISPFDVFGPSSSDHRAIPNRPKITDMT